jgi:hypothetical protein
MIIELNEQSRRILIEVVTQARWSLKKDNMKNTRYRILRDIELVLERSKEDDGRGFLSKKEVL